MQNKLKWKCGVLKSKSPAKVITRSLWYFIYYIVWCDTLKDITMKQPNVFAGILSQSFSIRFDELEKSQPNIAKFSFS